MKIFKKTCLVIFKVLLIIGLVITLNKIFIPKYIEDNQDGRITGEYYYEKDTDVCFVGSSTVYSGISPAVLFSEYGITSYDRSNASQTMAISYYMIEDAIKYDKPKLVALDVGFIKYGDDFVEEPSSRKSIDGMRMSLQKINCIKAAMGEDEDMLDYIFPIFRFHSRWKEIKAEDFLKAYYYKPVTHNGFILNYKESETVPDKLEYLENADTKLTDGNLDYLNKVIKLCDDNDVELFLFKMPSRANNWNFDYDKQIEEVASNNNVEYINFDTYSDEIGIDFLIHSPDGGSHLNTPGAEVFTKYFGGLLKERFELPDRRNDEKLKRKWEIKLTDYENAKAKKPIIGED